MISGVILSAEFLNEMTRPVVNEPEYSKGTPVTVFPTDICFLAWIEDDSISRRQLITEDSKRFNSNDSLAGIMATSRIV